MKTQPVLLAALLLTGSGWAQTQEEQHDQEALMQAMQDTMEQIRRTQDPEERAALLEQHMQQMHSAMAQLHRDIGRMMQQMDAQARERRHDHAKRRRQGH